MTLSAPRGPSYGNLRSPLNFARFYLADLLPDADRVVYLDADAVAVVGDDDEDSDAARYEVGDDDFDPELDEKFSRMLATPEGQAALEAERTRADRLLEARRREKAAGGEGFTLTYAPAAGVRTVNAKSVVSTAPAHALKDVLAEYIVRASAARFTV